MIQTSTGLLWKIWRLEEAGEEAASHLLHTVHKVLFNVEASIERLRACRSPGSGRGCLCVCICMRWDTGLGYSLDFGFWGLYGWATHAYLCHHFWLLWAWISYLLVTGRNRTTAPIIHSVCVCVCPRLQMFLRVDLPWCICSHVHCVYSHVLFWVDVCVWSHLLLSLTCMQKITPNELGGKCEEALIK